MSLSSHPPQDLDVTHKNTAAFTLIELSIVLVIIGLIVGGVIVGQDLVSAAATGAQIAQIEKYNSAVTTFETKFGYLPGDIPDPYASRFGFVQRGTSPGEGDGNGIIEGNSSLGACGYCVSAGEPLYFWMDLTAARMVEGSFTAAQVGTTNTAIISSTGIGQFIPPAKIGNGNYIYTWSGGPLVASGGTNQIGSNQQNYFGLSVTYEFDYWANQSKPGLTVAQAYNIDKKIDDGLPQSGKVVAMYMDSISNLCNPTWAGSGGQTGAPYTTATAGTTSTCFDNSYAGGSAAPMHYSTQVNNGSGVNCALSFQMQGAGR